MFRAVVFILTCCSLAEGFVVERTTSCRRRQPLTSLQAVLNPVDQRRKVLLGRKGPYFELTRTNGNVEFGATANLVTELGSTRRADEINEWLQDERSLALSIWDENLME